MKVQTNYFTLKYLDSSGRQLDFILISFCSESAEADHL